MGPRLGRHPCSARGSGGAHRDALRRDSPVHAGFVARDLVKRVTPLQEQPCQLDGQGPVGELGSRDKLSPALSTCFRCTCSGPGCPAAILGRGAGREGPGPGGAGRAFPLSPSLSLSCSSSTVKAAVLLQTGPRPWEWGLGSGLTWVTAEKNTCSRVGTAWAHWSTRAQLAMGCSTW